MEVTIPQKWTDLVLCSSQIIALDNIYPKYTWFTPDIEEYHRETPSHDLSVAQYNNINALIASQSVP